MNIRNYLICAHVDHGKSTLADRMLEITGTVPHRLMKPQYLDQLELERERGITIKMAPVRMKFDVRNVRDVRGGNSSNTQHPTPNNTEFILNLIDTPGHSDFSYEVSRAMSAVEGAIVLVDATQGIQAQTLSNFEHTRKAGLTIIGAVSKIDAATPEQIMEAVQELAQLIGAPEEEIFKVSGKTGEGVTQLLEAVIERIPSPKVTISNNQYPITNYSRALIFDSLYDDHKGVIAFVRVFSAGGGSASGGNGEFRAGETMRLIAGEREFKAKEVGYFAPKLVTCDVVTNGEIGYIATGIKDPNTLKIGDTILSNFQFPISPATDSKNLWTAGSRLRRDNYQNLALPGYQEPNPVVFVSFYPEDTSKYDELKQALAKLHLTDAALKFEPDMSEVLGRGFKGGFLGRLHFEIAAERLNREFHVQTVHSFPSVAYKVKSDMRPATWTEITNPKDFPSDAGAVEEPMTKIEIVAPPAYLGAVLRLKELFRLSAIQTKMLEHKVVVEARLPLADLVSDFDDKLKSATAGFASFSYEVVGWEKADVEKLDILVAEHLVPGLSRILPRSDLEREGRATVLKLKKLLPQQAYAQALQAVSRGRVLARETIPAHRKLLGNFGKTGGDRTRKMKLWKKQQRGKARLQELASKTQIRIPAGVFKELLKK